MTTKLRIAQDIDGCWYRFTGAYTSLYNALKGTDHSPEWTEHNEFLNWGQTVPEFLDLLERAPFVLYGDLQANMIDRELAHRLVHDFDVTFVTARNDNAHRVTQLFLHTLVPKGKAHLRFGRDKSHADFDLAVEDYPKHLFEYAAAGVPNLALINRPYNLDSDAPEGTFRFDTWEQFYEYASTLQAAL